jgi:hypothetical protein
MVSESRAPRIVLVRGVLSCERLQELPHVDEVRACVTCVGCGGTWPGRARGIRPGRRSAAANRVARRHQLDLARLDLLRLLRPLGAARPFGSVAAAGWNDPDQQRAPARSHTDSGGARATTRRVQLPAGRATGRCALTYVERAERAEHRGSRQHLVSFDQHRDARLVRHSHVNFRR